MVPVGVTDYDNKYNEYIVIEGVIEPVGDWSVNLNDYVSRTELNTALVSKVDKIEGGSLFMQADATKLASIEEGAQINKIETVDETQFNLSNKHLTLLDIPITKVTDLEAVLNGKVDKKDGYRLMSEAEATKLATAEENYISSVDEVHFAVANKKLSLLDIPITKVTDLESILNNKADKSDITAVNTGMATLSARVATVEAAIQWTDLSIT